MKNVLNALLYFVLIIWQLPQNILGLIVGLFALLTGKTKKISRFEDEWLIFGKLFRSGVSLGYYIVLDELYLSYNQKSRETVFNHEYGHSKQSKYLGPLYLIIIGIPSFIGNIYFRIIKNKISSQERIKRYYNQPWEKWADKLGGVNRS